MARVPVEQRYEYYEKATNNGEIISKAGIISIWKKLQKSQKQDKKKAVPTLPPISDRYQLHHCSCEDLVDVIPAGSQQWIITDPPYPQEYLHTFSELSKLANHALVDGGLMVVMSGHSYLPEVIQRLGERMTYHWCGAYLTPGGQSAGLHSRRVNTFWKPLLIYSKGKYNGPVFGDVSKSEVNDNDKQHHEWGQSVSGMNDIIERFTMPGDTIVDPFLGGGTTCLSALLKDRLFIGCDIDEEHINETLRRIENVCK
jgi:site-specific DNA-methyltransferase (adenine-specific)